MRIDIISLFPELIETFFQHSIIGRARAAGLLDLDVTNPRNFTYDRHHMVDDTIYGGGCGMLMKAAPLYAAVEAVRRQVPRRRIIFMGPAGQTFTQAKARELATYDQLILLCGHYEGVDYRVEQDLADETISVGDYVLTGGELPAMTVTDAVARMIPGVLGAAAGAADDSFYSSLLEYPQSFAAWPYRRSCGTATTPRSMPGAGKRRWRGPWNYGRTFCSIAICRQLTKRYWLN